MIQTEEKATRYKKALDECMKLSKSDSSSWEIQFTIQKALGIEEMREYGVHFSSEFNSTLFTKCCSAAIGSEDRCPICKNLIIGHEIKDHKSCIDYRRECAN